MTIQELWEWAQKYGYLDLPIRIISRDRSGLWLGHSALRRKGITIKDDYVMLEGEQGVKWE